MKQMRSRFRLLTLLLACAFFLTLVLCAGSVLRTAGFSIDPRSWLQTVKPSVSPDPSLSPDSPEQPGTSPSPAEGSPSENSLPGTDIILDSEYNLFGL